MPSSGFNLDFLSLLQNAFAGRFSPRQEDGLAKLAVNSASVAAPRGVSGPSTMNWQDLISGWSRQGGGAMDQRWRGFVRQPAQPQAPAVHPWAQGMGLSNNQFLSFMGGLYGR